MRIRKNILAVLLFALTSLVFLVPVSASTAISPPNHRTNLKPGESEFVTITLHNQSSEVADYVLDPAEFTWDQQSSLQLIESEADILTNNWLLFPSAIAVPAETKAEIQVLIQIPENTEPGAYAPAVVISESSGSQSETGEGGLATDINVSLAFPIGINVYQQMPSTTVEVTQLAIDSPITGNKAELEYEFTNLSSYYAKPTAQLQILAGDGTRVYSKTINDDFSTLAPGIEIGEVITLTESDLDLNSIGQYQVELLVTDTQFDTADIQKIDFWVVPAAYIIVGVLLILGMFIGLVVLLALRHRRKKERLLKMGK